MSDANNVSAGFPRVTAGHKWDLAPGGTMIVLGVILLLIGWITHISIISTVGTILLVVGLVLLLLGSAGRGIGGRRWYY
jgi:uncharacterized membrane protein HdeD (DUF308 family)